MIFYWTSCYVFHYYLFDLLSCFLSLFIWVYIFNIKIIDHLCSWGKLVYSFSDRLTLDIFDLLSLTPWAGILVSFYACTSLYAGKLLVLCLVTHHWHYTYTLVVFCFMNDHHYHLICSRNLSHKTALCITQLI